MEKIESRYMYPLYGATELRRYPVYWSDLGLADV